MGSLKVLYVRRVTDDARSAILAMFPAAVVTNNSVFISAVLDSHEKPPEHDLMVLSARLETDVMWLGFQSVVDVFEYYHWSTGTLLRALVYGCYRQERTWERIEGQPEAWEQAAFFDPEDLALLLNDEDIDDEDKLSGEEKQRLEQFWQAGELVAGETEPVLSARGCALNIATYYQFPGWNFERAD